MSGAALQTRAAVLWPGAASWETDGITLDAPGPSEVLVRLESAGLCHSDAHLVSGGYPGLRRPIVGGHEGAGVVEAVGRDVSRVHPGDHVVLSYLPSCESCHACKAGLQNLCERGAAIPQGFQLEDGTARHHASGEDLSTFCLIGAFAAHTVVHEATCVPVDRDLPFDQLCLLGCAGLTGWGAAVHSAGVRPGDTTVVVGVGGVGALALKGARHAGAGHLVGVDPVPFKRTAAVALGADTAYVSMADALEPLREATGGRMADQVVMAMGEGDGAMLGQALALVGKRGRVVVVNVHPGDENSATVSLRDLQSYEKQVVGCLGGSWPPRTGIRHLAGLLRSGELRLDDVITSRYRLDELDRGYADQAAGRNLRGVVVDFAAA